MKLRTSMPMTLAIQGTVVVVSLSALSFDQSHDERVVLLTMTLLACSSLWLTVQEEKLLYYRVKHLQHLLEIALSTSPPSPPPLVATSPEEPEEEPEEGEEHLEEEPEDWLFLLELTARQYNSPGWPFRKPDEHNERKGEQLL